MSNNKAIVIIMICYFIFMLLMLKFEDNKCKPEPSIQDLNIKTFTCSNQISLDGVYDLNPRCISYE